ncbi:hypothetical protein [Algoriphagus sp. PAP.12]|uniref:hypothetical protein n=1 Tax=Algoriphagus sp. PAP.12 TaxID=2996678 RepID=UPI00227BC749|nr:hypothetical protein [Algoriphagus sp. PAP.12]
MDTLLFLIIFFLLLLIFGVANRIFRRKEAFLTNSIDQHDLEKKTLLEKIENLEKNGNQLELEVIKNRNLNLELNSEIELKEEEILALRKIIEKLQQQKESQNDDIIIEYNIKKTKEEC